MAKLSTDELVDVFKDLTLLELSAFVKKFEDTFDVSAAPPAAAHVDTVVEAEPVEVQTEFDVILEAVGDKKIHVIKVVREITKLGLKEAKDLVDAAPKQVLGMVTRDAADEAAARLKDAGATVIVR